MLGKLVVCELDGECELTYPGGTQTNSLRYKRSDGLGRMEKTLTSATLYNIDRCSFL